MRMFQRYFYIVNGKLNWLWSLSRNEWCCHENFWTCFGKHVSLLQTALEVSLWVSEAVHRNVYCIMWSLGMLSSQACSVSSILSHCRHVMSRSSQLLLVHEHIMPRGWFPRHLTHSSVSCVPPSTRTAFSGPWTQRNSCSIYCCPATNHSSSLWPVTHRAWPVLRILSVWLWKTESFSYVFSWCLIRFFFNK